jgi:hypothetical protein
MAKSPEEKAAEEAAKQAAKEQAAAEKAAEEEVKRAEAEAKAAAKAAEKHGTESVSVYDKAGAFVRTYVPSQSDENLDFIAKAEGFAKKIGGTVRKS